MLEELWLQTFAGKQFRPYDPKPDQIDIEDIAVALSKQCRYAGHTMKFYSIAQHCVLTSLIVPEEHALCALLHDATEAYIADIPSPAKRGLSQYYELEDLIWKKAIAPKFGLPLEMPPEVKKADFDMLAIERRDVMAEYGYDWNIVSADMPDLPPIVPLHHELAKSLFMNRFLELTKEKPNG